MVTVCAFPAMKVWAPGGEACPPAQGWGGGEGGRGGGGGGEGEGEYEKQVERDRLGEKYELAFYLWLALWESLGYEWESLSPMCANALPAKICSSPVPAGCGQPSACPHLVLVGGGTI